MQLRKRIFHNQSLKTPIADEPPSRLLTLGVILDGGEAMQLLQVRFSNSMKPFLCYNLPSLAPNYGGFYILQNSKKKRRSSQRASLRAPKIRLSISPFAPPTESLKVCLK